MLAEQICGLRVYRAAQGLACVRRERLSSTLQAWSATRITATAVLVRPTASNGMG